MKIRAVAIILAVMMLFTCGFTTAGSAVPSAPEVSAPEVSTRLPSQSDADSQLLARVENMLAHNFVYNDDFDSTNAMVDNSLIALLENADDEGYISRELVLGFVFNMYGITLEEYAPSPLFPEKEGCIFVIPRGVENYSHEIVMIERDGEYLNVDSVLTIKSHEGFSYKFSCRTLFKESADSSFGYNIVSCIYY